MFIIHFATIPPRQTLLASTIVSWLTQDIYDKIEAIVITIPKVSKLYGDYNPYDFYSLKFNKLKLQVLENDYGPSNKIIGAISYKKATNTKSSFIICDDDIIYNNVTINEYIKAIEKDDVSCHTPFKTYDLLGLGFNRICGADSFYLSNTFFEREKDDKYEDFYNYCISNCPDMFFNDDYIISAYLSKIKINVKQILPPFYYYATVHNINQIHDDKDKKVRLEHCHEFLKNVFNKS